MEAQSRARREPRCPAPRASPWQCRPALGWALVGDKPGLKTCREALLRARGKEQAQVPCWAQHSQSPWPGSRYQMAPAQGILGEPDATGALSAWLQARSKAAGSSVPGTPANPQPGSRPGGLRGLWGSGQPTREAMPWLQEWQGPTRAPNTAARALAELRRPIPLGTG